MPRKNIKFLLSLILFSLLPTAHAEINPISAPPLMIVSQTPSNESLQKLMAVVHFDTSLNQRLTQSKNVIKQIFPKVLIDNLAKKTLNIEQQQQVEQVLTEFAEKVLDEENKPEIRQQLMQTYIEVAKTTYSQEEVNAMIAFYGSKVGQAIQSKQPIFSEAMTPKIMPLILDNQQKALQKYLPEMQQKIEKIAKQSPAKAEK